MTPTPEELAAVLAALAARRAEQREPTGYERWRRIRLEARRRTA